MFLDRLEQACSRAERSKQSVAVMFIDLDGFKPINDGHGHEVGDEALRQVAQRLSKAVRRTDTVARFGGDEFVVILSDLNDPRSNVAAMAANFREAFSMPFAVGSLSLTLGLSIGSAVYPDDGKDPDMLLSHADRAMYADKKTARPATQVVAEGLS
jgi:diguanylate cyclase (GGDEF)-like protein